MPEHEDTNRTVLALQEEIEHLKQALVSHAVIDQAIGIVIAHGNMPPERAWTVLREVSQHTNIKLRQVAEHLVQWPHRGWLPPAIGGALRSALERHTRCTERPRARTSAAPVRAEAQPCKVLDGLVP